jgi:tRNA modification GTPase
LKTAEILLEQVEGALAHAVDRLIAGLSNDRLATLEALDTLISRAEIGLRLVTGWTVALAGRPNVGKSRLLNALAGYDRAIVDPTPGTTRDVLTVRTALDGWPVELADTAGLRNAADPLESAGIALARRQQARADLTVLVLDRSEPLTADDHALIASAPNALRVANKADLPSAWQANDQGVAATVSAERGDGLDDLIREIARRLVPQPPPPRAGIPFRPSHRRRLIAARRALQTHDVATADALLRPLATVSQPRRVPATGGPLRDS